MLRHTFVFGACALSACQEYDLQGDRDPAVPDDSGAPDDPPSTTSPAPEPDIQVDPPSLDFGLLPKDCTSERKSVTVTNVGTLDLEVRGVTLIDNDASAYRHLATPDWLPPGGSLEIEVDFTPPDWDTYGDTVVRVDSNDPDEPEVDVSLLGVGAEDGIIEEHFTQNLVMPVDVLWVMDNSGSMSGELDHLADTFDVFINAFVGLGLDYQLGVVTTDMDNPAQAGILQGPTRVITAADPDPVGAFAAAIDQGASGSGDERGLDAAYAALTDPLISNENFGMVRPGSNLSVIVVTDENDSSDVAPLDFAAWLDAYQGDPALSSFSAVAGPTSGFFPCVSFFSGVSADPAPRYWTAVSNTGGLHVSICNLDMTTILTQLAVVSSGMKLTFPLGYTVTDPAGIVVEVDGVVVPEDAVNGWTYDAATNCIVFHGSAVPGPGADVAFTYPMITTCPT